MRRYAITVAVAGFFVLAAVGCCCQVPLWLCGLRALGGAAALYVMTQLAGRVVLGIVVDAMIQNSHARGSAREHRNQ